MAERSVLNSIDLFRKELMAKGINISRIILYGSCAKGMETDSSDIDVVVISNDFAEKDYWERIDILSDAIYNVFEPIEAVAMTPEEWQKGDSFVVDYAKNGEVVYTD